MKTKIYNESSQTLLNLVMNLKEGKSTNFGKNQITKF
jgi:hypothetical protein